MLMTRTRLFSSVLFCAALALGGGLLPSPAHAVDPNPLSVHVLDLQTGLPSPGVEVVLERQTATGWTHLATARSDEQGRIRALWPQGVRYESGVYRVVFRTGEFFSQRKQNTFFPEIPVVFRVDASQAHYHIPLLLSPFGYSTYRGN